MILVQHRSFWLEVTPDAFVPSGQLQLNCIRALPNTWESAKSLWCECGRGFWTARSRWSPERWQSHLSDRVIQFFIAVARQDQVGFFELVAQHRSIRIEGLGLLPCQRAKGLGGPLLTSAVREAFRLGAPRVTLHTATDDHPSAMANYLARGFRIYREGVLTNPMRPSSTGLQ